MFANPSLGERKKNRHPPCVFKRVKLSQHFFFRILCLVCLFVVVQLAVSFLHYDEIELFDFETILPNSDAAPLLTLTPAGRGGVGGGSGRSAGGFVGGGFRGGQGGGVGAAHRSSGGSRGLGHLSFEFVLKGSPGNMMTHVVAGGRQGTFRVWRFGPRSAGQLAPYLQVRAERVVGRREREKGFGRKGWRCLIFGALFHVEDLLGGVRSARRA